MEQIDILLATYNGEKYLIEQIESILNQTYSNFRLLISDDCSNDNTRKILKEYETKDKRIKVFYQEKNLGYVKNFEFLLTKVENDIYMLSDQDDVWIKEKIEKTYKKLKEENSDLVFTDLEVVNEKLETITSSFNDYMLLSRKIKNYYTDYRMQYLYNCITGCTLMSKKSFLDKIIPIPTDSKYVIHDSWIGLIVSLYGKVIYLDEKTIKYRQHGNNEVGIDKISHKYKKIEDVRNLFIEVKLMLFKTYVNNEKCFPDDLKKQNKKALEYFEMLQNKKNMNFKNWNIFYKLYKTETFSYYIKNFMILNMPLITNIPFKIRHYILKLRGKR
ncbi:MAG: glycosyltransferase family 2 protein [Clostridiaceae bacterium]|nr:glycosyltransferase family 2 protein [Clostridiaceae bacterium]